MVVVEPDPDSANQLGGKTNEPAVPRCSGFSRDRQAEAARPDAGRGPALNDRLQHSDDVYGARQCLPQRHVAMERAPEIARLVLLPAKLERGWLIGQDAGWSENGLATIDPGVKRRRIYKRLESRARLASGNGTIQL